jgi:hypothetical protein
MCIAALRVGQVVGGPSGAREVALLRMIVYGAFFQSGSSRPTFLPAVVVIDFRTHSFSAEHREEVRPWHCPRSRALRRCPLFITFPRALSAHCRVPPWRRVRVH